MSVVDMLMRVEVSDHHQQTLDSTSHSWSPEGLQTNDQIALSEKELMHESWPRRAVTSSSSSSNDRHHQSKQEREQFEVSQSKEMITSWLDYKEEYSEYSSEDFLGTPWPRPRITTANTKDINKKVKRRRQKQQQQQQQEKLHHDSDKWMSQSMNTIQELSDEEGSSDVFDFSALLQQQQQLNQSNSDDLNSSVSTLDPMLDRWSVNPTTTRPIATTRTIETPTLLDDGKDIEPDMGRLMFPTRSSER
jgi:hypothetical protein